MAKKNNIMTREELQIEKCYSRDDDALYKIVALGDDWVMVWAYSFNHNVASPWIYTVEDFVSDGLKEEDENEERWLYDIFNNLKYGSYDVLKGE